MQATITKRSQILDGKALAAESSDDLKSKIAKWRADGNPQPKLAVLSVGKDPASQIYIKAKTCKCEELGIAAEIFSFPENSNLKTVADKIKYLNEDPSTHGILLQLPLPKSLNAFELIELIVPSKDVDGLCTANAGKLVSSVPGGVIPCTPKGCMKLIRKSGINLRGINALVIGASNLVGRPVSILLSQKGATVTVATSAVQNLKEKVENADLIVSATGQAHLVKGEWIKKGSVVIDVGIIRQTASDGQSKIVGDVQFDKALEKAAFITPVPGGVGPLTVAMLMDNIVSCYLKIEGIDV